MHLPGLRKMFLPKILSQPAGLCARVIQCWWLRKTDNPVNPPVICCQPVLQSPRALKRFRQGIYGSSGHALEAHLGFVHAQVHAQDHGRVQMWGVVHGIGVGLR